MILIDAEVLIHVKQCHFAPVDAAQVHEGFLKLNLRVASGEYCRDFTLAGDSFYEVIVDSLSHVGCHVRLGRINPDGQRVGCE